MKVFNVINKNEAKTITKRISCASKCKFNSTTRNSNQKWNIKHANKTCQCECKNCLKCKKYYSWNPSICICDNSKYIKSIADILVIMCDEIITVMAIV